MTGRCDHCGEPYGEAAATCPECRDLEQAVVLTAGDYLRCRTPGRLHVLAEAHAAYARAVRRPCPTCGETLEAAEDREAGVHAGACLSAEVQANAGDREDHRRREEARR